MRSAKCMALAAIVLSCSAAVYAVTYVVPTDEVLVGKANAVVIARALTSYVEESKEHGLETVTVLSVEDVLKGGLLRHGEIKVRTIGGVLKSRFKIIPGAPRFTDGQRVLVFLNALGDGDYVVTDFGLGLFGFADDDTGREVLIRTTTEIEGWDIDGKAHHEPRRDAEKFLGFIRGTARQLPVKADYTVEPRPLVTDEKHTPGGRLQMAALSYSVLQYTMAPYGGTESDYGFRWGAFPSSVSWNRGNAATGLTNGGSDAINAAFASWYNDADSNVNIVLVATTPDTDGIQEAADGLNNIVFEKDLVGYNDFVCGSGGVLGFGGINNSSGTNTVGSDTFYNIIEGDVSMNKGVGACIGGSLSLSNYNSALTHEVGHTLGLRHSNQNRLGDSACPVSYDCSTSALMTSVITSGLNGALQTWDHSAMAALYPVAGPVAPPTNVVATATGFIACTFMGCSRGVTVSWTGIGPSATYEVYANQGTGWPETPILTTLAGVTSTTISLDPSKAYLVCVKAFDGGNRSTCSSPDYTYVGLPPVGGFTAAGTLIYASQFTQMRNAVNALLTLSSHAAYAGWTDPTITPQVTPIKDEHITELRNKLNEALGYLGFTAKTWAESVAGGTAIRASHIAELQAAAQ